MRAPPIAWLIGNVTQERMNASDDRPSPARDEIRCIGHIGGEEWHTVIGSELHVQVGLEDIDAKRRAGDLIGIQPA